MDLSISPTVFRLPRSHWHCDLETFQWDRLHPASLQKHYEQFLTQLVDGGAAHLLLTGAPGIGKTHLGVVAYRWAAARLGTELTTWINIPTFCSRVKQAFSSDFDPMLEYEAARRLVVLDDLFGRDLSAFEASQIVYRLIDSAYQNGASVLITMNQPADDLKNRLPAHEVSRVLAGAQIAALTSAKDWRRV